MRLVVLLLLVARTAFADRPVIEVPATRDPVPLVVILHGDRETARAAAARWRGAVKKRGWALLSLAVPEGTSFWKWDGDPAWVKDQIAAVDHVDRDHIYLIGWSGGATYIGMHAQAWPDTFAAVVLHGGGVAPADDACVALPAYFLVGDRNPLHALARQLRAYFDACDDAPVWDLVRGGDHAKEEAALTGPKAATILGWLADHRLAH